MGRKNEKMKTDLLVKGQAGGIYTAPISSSAHRRGSNEIRGLLVSLSLERNGASGEFEGAGIVGAEKEQRNIVEHKEEFKEKSGRHIIYSLMARWRGFERQRA